MFDAVLRYPKTTALIAGGIAACGFAPLDFWPLTLAGLAVLIVLIARADTGWSAFARGWWWGVGHFTIGLNWIAHAFTFQYFMPAWTGYIAVFLLSLYLALYPAAAAWLAWRITSPRRRPGPVMLEVPTAIAAPASAGATLTVAFAAAWIATEYLRATLFTGFAWNPLGVIWVPTNLAALSTLLGTYGLSGVTVLLTGWIAHAASVRTTRAVATSAAIATAFALLLLIPLGGPAIRGGPLLRIVQPNVSQAERHNRNIDEDSVVRLERLTGPPVAEPRLILWPEAAVPYYLEEEDWARARLARLLGPRDVLLTGGTTLLYDKQKKLIAAHNSVFAMDAAGTLTARYDKAHLVPYGEYLPMRPLLGAIGLSQLVQSDVDFVPGPAPLTYDIAGFGKVAMQICYEIIFSGQVVDRANRPGFIFNPSTDAWFGRWGPPQHLAQARMRAVEEGLPVIRATPTGISAVIDADGRLLAALPLDKPGFIATRLPTAKPPTLFARAGNTIPLALAMLLAFAAVAARRRGR